MLKFIKFTKKLFLFMLMSILPIQSFAAVSVSDGSAFVSKSEFSASLNSMSNRIAIIENTLDAKIDSLVSSYLSRNGIWNGEKQTVTSVPTTQVGLKWQESSNIRGYVYSQGINGLGGTSASGFDVTSDTVYYNPQFKYTPVATSALTHTIVNSSTKSGLCNLQINYDTNTTSYKFGTFNGIKLNDATHGDWWGTSYNFMIDIYTVTAGTNTLRFHDEQTFSFPVHATYTLTYKTIINCYFFITKGDSIKIVEKPTVSSGPYPQTYYEAKNMGVKIKSWQAIVY